MTCIERRANRTAPLRRIALAVVAALAFGPSTATYAHPISLVQADVFVAADRMTAKFEVFLEDLFFFHGLEADAENRLPAEALEKAADAHADFLASRFRILRPDGSVYEPVYAKRIEGEIPAEGVPLGELMQNSLAYEIGYAVDEAPEYLTFEQRFLGEEFRVPSSVTLRVWQGGAEDPLAVQTLSPRDPFSIRLDWDSPNPPALASLEAWDVWTESRRRSTLGITSYSSTYTFLYIEPTEVRHEILVPLLSLETDDWRVPRADPDQLTPEEQVAAKEAAADRIAPQVPLAIDGELREPVVDRVDFYGIDFADFAMQAPRETVGAASARIGIILRYPCETPPRSVTLGWNLFGEDLHAVQTVVFAPDRSYDVEFSSVEPDETFEWTRDAALEPPREIETFAAPPLPSRTLANATAVVGLVVVLASWLVARFARRRSRIVAAGATAAGLAIGLALFGFSYWRAGSDLREARLSDEEALAVARNLHGQIYAAFDEPTEAKRYERLEASLADDLVREAYLEIADRLRMEEQGGASLRIDEVSPIRGEALPAADDGGDPRSFAVDGVWTVTGRVEHWGHVHSRKNAYRGRLLVAPRDGFWKIVRMDLLSDERLESKTTLREF